MTRASLRQADIERLIRAAEKTGSLVQVDLKTYVATIFPGAGPPPKLGLSPSIVSDDVDDREDNSTSKWRLWDPVTDPPQPIQKAFDHREYAAMKRLVELGVGRKLHPSEVRGFGPHTQKKLADRGYLEIIHGLSGQDDEVSITKKGMADWKAQEAHDEKYWKGL